MSMCVICDGCRKHFALEMWDGAGCETPADDEIDRNDLCRDCMAKAVALLKEFPDPLEIAPVEAPWSMTLGKIHPGSTYTADPSVIPAGLDVELAFRGAVTGQIVRFSDDGVPDGLEVEMSNGLWSWKLPYHTRWSTFLPRDGEVILIEKKEEEK